MGDDSAKCLYRSMSSSHNRMTRPISSAHASAVQSSSVDPIVSSSVLDGRHVSSEPARHLLSRSFFQHWMKRGSTLTRVLLSPLGPQSSLRRGCRWWGPCASRHLEIGTSPASVTRIFSNARLHGWGIIWWHFLSKKGHLHGFWGPYTMVTPIGR